MLLFTGNVSVFVKESMDKKQTKNDADFESNESEE